MDTLIPTPLLLLFSTLASAQQPQPVATFSIVACDPDAGEWGVAVASRYFSVGAVVPWAEAGVGAVATQANVNVGYGSRGLDLLRQGLSARQVVETLLAEDAFGGTDTRQLAVADHNCGVAAYTGPKANRWAGDRQGKHWSAQGNILTGPEVVEAMGRAFEATTGDLAEKMYAALKAGDDAGGDSRGRQSASLLVVRKLGGRNINNDRPVFVNVDDHPRPMVELRRLLDLNQSLLYSQRSFQLSNAGRHKEALAAARFAARYRKDEPDLHLLLGFLEYFAGNKDTAVAELLEAKKALPEFRKRFESMATRPGYRTILEDAAFLRRILE